MIASLFVCPAKCNREVSDLFQSGVFSVSETSGLEFDLGAKSENVIAQIVLVMG